MRVFDLAIVNGTVVTMDPNRRIIPRGLVLIHGENLEYVGPAGEEKFPWKAEQTLDARRSIVMPGLIDVHGHAGHSLVKTMGDRGRDTWESVAEDVYFRNSTDAFWHAEAALAGLERLRFGVTCGYSMMGNMPRTDDVRWSLSHISGMRTVGIRDIVGIGPGLPPWPKTVRQWEKGRPTTREFHMEASLEVTEEICRMASRGDFGDRVTVHVSPSRVGDPEGLGEDTLLNQTREFTRIARDHGLMINSHAYQGNVAYAYHHLDVLGPNTLLAHCTGISADEVRYLADTGTHVAHCPSARSVARGWCPAPDLIDAGVNVALATDGTAPDRSFCVFKEMRTAAIIHHIHEGDDGVLPPGKLLEMVTIDAAKAVGLAGLIGSLEAGKRADVILVDVNAPHQYPLTMPVHRLAYVTSGQDVSTVIVNGAVLMHNRRTRIDEEAIFGEAQEEFRAAVARAGLEAELEIPERFWGHSRY